MYLLKHSISITCFIICLLLSSCSKKIIDNTIKKPEQIEEQKTNNLSSVTNCIIETAKKYLNSPYKYGGTSSSGFDCSGYVQFVCSKCNISLPRSSADMANCGEKVDYNNIKESDLVFFKSRDINSNKVGHVGITIEKTKTKFIIIHSSTSNGVILTDVEQSKYWKERFLFARRIKN